MRGVRRPVPVTSCRGRFARWAASNGRCSPGNGYPIRRYANAAMPVSTRARPATRCSARCSSIVREKFKIAPSKPEFPRIGSEPHHRRHSSLEYGLSRPCCPAPRRSRSFRPRRKRFRRRWPIFLNGLPPFRNEPGSSPRGRLVQRPGLSSRSNESR